MGGGVEKIKSILGVTEAFFFCQEIAGSLKRDLVEVSTGHLEELVSALRRLKNALIFNKV